MRVKTLALLFAIALTTVVLHAQSPGWNRSFNSILDPALLGKPPIDAWPPYHGDYTGRRYSTLKQINASNVKNLTLAWVYRLNTSGTGARTGGEGRDASPVGAAAVPTIKSTPLMLNGVLYFSAPDHVWALDARTGR